MPSCCAALITGVMSAATGDFHALAAEHRVFSRVEVAHGPRGRGLFVTEPVAAGEPILVVPWSLCLVAGADVSDPVSPWGAPHSHGRDTLLATMLLEALEVGEASSLPEDTADFWRRWSTMLPALGTTAHPLTLPDELLAELQDGELVGAALMQRNRADAVCGGPPAQHAQRCWALAMCSSRPFTIPRRQGEAACETCGAGAEEASQGGTAAGTATCGEGSQLTAFVPFLDMANHDADDANCEVQGRGDAEAYHAVGLVATRDLAAGEEATISYFSTVQSESNAERAAPANSGGGCAPASGRLIPPNPASPHISSRSTQTPSLSPNSVSSAPEAIGTIAGASNPPSRRSPASLSKILS